MIIILNKKRSKLSATRLNERNYSVKKFTSS